MALLVNRLSRASSFTSLNNLVENVRLVQYSQHLLQTTSTNSKYCGVKFYSQTPDSDDPEPPVHPVKRIWNVLKHDMKYAQKALDGEFKMPYFFPKHCDVLVVGGGIIGSSIAYWLKQRALASLNVVVVDKDPSVINFNEFEYHKSSNRLSVGGLQQQFSMPENIEMANFGAEFFRKIDEYLSIDDCDSPSLNFTPHGYLFTANEENAQVLEETWRLQKDLGSLVELLTSQQIKEKWPWMNVNDIAMGCHGLANEGWLDSFKLLTAFKRKAQHLGAEYINAELTGFRWRPLTDIVMDGYEPGQYKALNEAIITLPDGTRKKMEFAILVIAAGYSSKEVGKLAKFGEGERFFSLPIPVQKRKRYVYSFQCPDGPKMTAPFVVDHNNIYFRREGLGDNYICSRIPDVNEADCDSLDVDYDYFKEKVWPLLAHRVPAFERIKVNGGQTVFYDHSWFDGCPMVGPHPAYMNVFMATGFNGQGLQQAPAVGRAMMELIVDGYYKTIDLTRLQFERTFHDEFLHETHYV